MIQYFNTKHNAIYVLIRKANDFYYHLERICSATICRESLFDNNMTPFQSQTRTVLYIPSHFEEVITASRKRWKLSPNASVVS